MKILVVVHGFPPDRSAGAERHAFQLARELDRLGADVVVLARAERPGLAPFARVEERHEGLRVLRLQNDWSGIHALSDTYADPDAAAAVAAVLDAERPDVVHVQHVIGVGVDVVRLAKERGIPCVVTLHDFWFHCARGQRFTPGGEVCAEIDHARCARCIAGKRASWAAAWLKAAAAGRAREGRDASALGRALGLLPRTARYLARESGTGPLERRFAAMREALGLADLLLAPSRFLADEYVRQGAPAGRMRVVGLGHEPLHAVPPPPRPRRDPAAPVRFGFVGSLLASKGIELLLDAFSGLGDARATLEVHGAAPREAPEARRIERAIARTPGVRAHGAFPHARLPEVLAALDVLCVPSLWWENAPLVLAEAAQARLPVVAADHGGLGEHARAHGNAVLFAPGDVAGLRAALRRFLDEPDLASRLSTAARPVETMAEAGARMLALFSSLVHDPERTPRR